MDIKKADSKGRVSGFEPGKYYSVARTEQGITLHVLHEGGYTGGPGPHGFVHPARWWDSDAQKGVYPGDD